MYVTDPNSTNRVIFRDPSGKGSIILLDMFGKKIEMLVFDAKYRTSKVWGAYGKELPLPSFRRDTCKVSPDEKLTDQQLQERFPSLAADKTARENLDILIQHHTSEVAWWCKRKGFELPNNYELLVIYQEADRLDALDPTVKKHPKHALGIANPMGRFYFGAKNMAWSSTSFDKFAARGIGPTGCIETRSKFEKMKVIPIKELNSF